MSTLNQFYGKTMPPVVRNPAVCYTADFDITSAHDGKTLSNLGATTDIKGTFAPDLPDGFSVRVVNEVGSMGFDTYTKLMLHFNNNDTDSSASAHSPTTTDLTYDNSAGEYKFGYSGVFNGTTSKIVYADSTEWDLGLSKEPFTISFWFKTTTNGTHNFLARVGSGSDWTMTNGYSYVYQYTGSAINFYYNKNNATSSVSVTTSTPHNGAWHHLALAYDGTTCKIALDGTWGGTSATDDFYKPSASNNFRFSGNTANDGIINGKIDELKIDKGICRWAIDTNFTPPNAEYYAGASLITLAPPTGSKLPNTSAINRNLVSSAKGDLIKVLKTSTNFVAEAYAPAVASWVDTAQ